MGQFWSRMNFEQLLTLQDDLDARFIRDELSLSQYEIEWSSLLSASGYTEQEYESGIDRRWDYIDYLRELSFWARSQKRLEN